MVRLPTFILSLRSSLHSSHPLPLGALSCPTRGGKQCVFPFTTKGGEEVSDCQPYNGKLFCATSLTKDHKYASWDYCKKDECKDVVDNPASKSIFGCIACIVQYAAVCVSSCIPNPFNTACTQCVLQHGIECAVTCGKEIHISSLSIYTNLYTKLQSTKVK